jgi:membrane protein required for beta-lactamase induction
VIASKGPRMSKEDTAGKRKHITLTIPQELEIIRTLDSVSLKNVIIYYKHVLIWLIILHVFKQQTYRLLAYTSMYEYLIARNVTNQLCS